MKNFIKILRFLTSHKRLFSIVFVAPFLFILKNDSINKPESSALAENQIIEGLCLDFCFIKEEYSIKNWSEFNPIAYIEYCENDNTYIEIPTNPKLGFEDDPFIELYFIFTQNGKKVDFSDIDYQYLSYKDLDGKTKLYKSDRHEFEINFSPFYRPEDIIKEGSYHVQAFLRLKTEAGQVFAIVPSNMIRISLLG